MASELHSLIEEELRHKNYKSTGNEEEKALIGALRVEARVKEHQHQKKVLTLKRSICVGGGLLVVIVLWVVLALKSKSASKHATGFTPSSVTPMPSTIPTGPSVVPAAAQPAVQPAAQPAVQPAVQPAAQPTVQPAVQPAAQPTVQPAAQPAEQSAASPTNSTSLPKVPGDYDDNYNFPNETQLDEEMNKNKFQPADGGDGTAPSTSPLPSDGAGGSADSGNTTNKTDSSGDGTQPRAAPFG
ncbi:hypothetical protein Vafri_16761 [Volvox africanus]|uniref:Uncharacterized protein n=1 Tax=Volvox africanus TaxID=51714 RepID=A0A8J4F717_9CHLO|nr:hypothetical protein Vafri_16761 [Volvox africanus]